MKIGIKVFNKEHIKWVIQNEKDIDIIYIGNEFCSRKFMDSINLIKEIRNLNKEIYISIPIIQQIHLEKVKDIIDDLLNESLNVTFIINDLGILFYLGTELRNKKCKIILGRLLNKNIESCPWYKHIIRNENQFIKEAMFMNSMNSKIVIDYFENFNVVGIESNMVLKQNNSLQQIKEEKYMIAIDYDYTYITSGRTCTAAYYFNKSVGECKNMCDKAIDVSLAEVKDVFSLKDKFHKDEEIMNIYGKMKVFGNCVMKENNNTVDDIKKDIIDVVLFDIRRYYKENLNLLNGNIQSVK